MNQSRGRMAKPLISAGLTFCLVLSFVLPVLQYNYLAGPATPFDPVQAGSIRYGVILTFALLWFGVQLFWRTSSEVTKFSMTISATILWLSFALLFPFNPPGGNFDKSTYGGAAAFFLLMGGLGIVLLWTRFFSDEIGY